MLKVNSTLRDPSAISKARCNYQPSKPHRRFEERIACCRPPATKHFASSRSGARGPAARAEFQEPTVLVFESHRCQQGQTGHCTAQVILPPRYSLGINRIIAAQTARISSQRLRQCRSVVSLQSWQRPPRKARARSNFWIWHFRPILRRAMELDAKGANPIIQRIRVQVSPPSTSANGM